MTKPTFFLLAVAVSTVACGDDQDPDGGRELYQRIMAENYQSFQTAPGYDTPQDSSAPHSDRTQVFLNSTIADVITAGMPVTEWPEGSLIVKDGYDGDGLDIIAAMEKRSDGWFWAEWLDPDDADSDFSGKPDTCTGCHDAGDDFVQAFDFPAAN